MIDAVFSGLAVADIHDDLFRNIVSLRASEDLFDDLSDDPAARQAALNLELETKPPAFESPTPIIHRPFEEAAWNDAIGYPFRHWMRSRFSDGTFGVWYGASEIETTVYETVHHWRFGLLEDARFTMPGVQIERKVYRVRCDAALLDFRRAIGHHPALIHPSDYSFTHQLGARLHREGHPGLVARSARCGGDTQAVLNPAVLSNPRQVCFLTYTTTADGVAIERNPGTVWITIAAS